MQSSVCDYKCVYAYVFHSSFTCESESSVNERCYLSYCPRISCDSYLSQSILSEHKESICIYSLPVFPPNAASLKVVNHLNNGKIRLSLPLHSSHSLL